MTRVLAPFHRWLKRRGVPARLRVVEGGKAAPVVTLVRAGTFDALDPDPYAQAFGDIASIPFEGKIS